MGYNSQASTWESGYDTAIVEIEEICDNLCYCKTREGTMYSKTKHGKEMCSFCWLKHRINEETS